MIPIKLNLSGFLSYQQAVEIDFSYFDLACISGPNGAGKSSILDAMTWALFGVARQRDDSLINARSNTAEVVFIFSYEGNTYLVQRTKPREKTTQLEFHILQEGDLASGVDVSWKPLTERTLRETQARIQSTLRMDYETFVNASFFLQGKADQFTQQRPGDRKRILGNILGLEIWEQYRQRAFERRRSIGGEIDSLDGRLREIDGELAEEKERRVYLKQLGKELKSLEKSRQASEASLETIRKITASLSNQRELVEALQRQLLASEKTRTELRIRLQSRLEEKDELAAIIKRSEEIETAYQTWQQAREELTQWEEIAGRFREQEGRRSAPLMEIQQARSRLEAELESLVKTQADIEANRQAVIVQGEEYANSVQALKAVQQKITERSRLEADLTETKVFEAALSTENSALRLEMESLKARMTQLEEVEGAICPLCGQSLAPPERESLVSQLGKEGGEKGDLYRANKIRLEETGQKIESLENGVKVLSSADSELQALTQETGQQAAHLEAMEKEITVWESTGAPRLAEIKKALQEESYAPEAWVQLGEIDAELKAIGYDAAAHDAVRKAEAEGRAQETGFRELVRARAALAPLEREIFETEKQAGDQDENIRRLQEEHQNAAAILAEAEARAPDLESAEAELFRLQEEENRLRMAVGAAQQKVAVLDDLKKRRDALSGEREDLATQVALYRKIERAFGKDGVPALLIEQALPQIESEANEILDRLSNGTMSIRFQTQASYKDKAREDLKETLDILISDSSGVRDYDLYSGGEAFRVNFAIRLALSKVLAQRAGARLQTLVVDEGFGSQDAAGRQRLIEAINQVRTEFAKILVITHIDDMREAFPSRIEVEKTDRGSMITIL
jgi:DNA repair protein SbcC/Rad50